MDSAVDQNATYHLASPPQPSEIVAASPARDAGDGTIWKGFVNVWRRLEVPLIEIFVHSVVTVASILSIAGIELLLHWVGLDGKAIPYTKITLSDWMFYLELLAANLIIVVGIIKAAIALVRS
jgi:hypothetical protein